MSQLDKQTPPDTSYCDINVSLAPAIAMASLYQNLAWSMGQQAIQSVQAQQQAYILQQTVTARNCWQLSQFN